MNTNDPWKKLADLARRQPPPAPAEPAEVPYGFESRVLARLRVPRGGASELWARLALRAVPLGAAVLLLCWVTLPDPSAAPLSAPDEIELLMEEVLNS